MVGGSHSSEKNVFADDELRPLFSLLEDYSERLRTKRLLRPRRRIREMLYSLRKRRSRCPSYVYPLHVLTDGAFFYPAFIAHPHIPVLTIRYRRTFQNRTVSPG